MRIPYPPDVKAFLYYYTSPEKTPASLGNYAFELHQVMILRLSKVESDLLRTDGLPWSRPLYSLSKSLYEKLREDQLNPDDLDGVLATIPKNLIQYSRNNVLYTLNDTFILNVSHSTPYFFARYRIKAWSRYDSLDGFSMLVKHIRV